MAQTYTTFRSIVVASIATLLGVGIVIEWRTILVLPILVLLYISIGNPTIPFYLMFSSIPITNNLPDIVFLSSATASLGLLAFIFFIISLIADKSITIKWRSSTYLWIAGLLISIILSSIFGPVFDISRIFSFLQLFLLVFLTNQLLDSYKKIERLMFLWICTMSLVQIYGLSGYDFSVIDKTNRFTTLANNSNELALFSIINIWFLVYYIFRVQSNLARALAGGAIVLSAATVLLSLSRNGFITLTLSLFYFLWIFRNRLNRKIIIVIIMAIMCLLVITWNIGLLNEIRDLPQLIIETSNNSRVSHFDPRTILWQSAFNTWRQYPIFGVGTGGGVALRVYLYQERVISSQNSFIGILVDNGILGLFFFSGALLHAWRNLLFTASQYNGGYRSDINDLSRTWQVVWVTIIGMSMSTGLEASKILWLLIGISIVFSQNSQSIKK
jgi:O-antigen ligase